MAITLTLVTAGTITLFPTSSVTQSINLAAGANRRFVVGIGARVQGTPLPPQTIPIVTYGGVPMEFMRRESDGAESFITGGQFSRVSVFWFGLRASQLPATGANDLVIDWSVLAGTNWGFRAVAYQLANADQGVRIRDFQAVASTAPSTSIGGTTAPGGTSDAILVAGMNALNTGTFQITIDGVGILEEFDSALGTVGRMCAGNDLTAGAVPGIPFSLAFSNGNNVAAVALRLAEFFPPNGQVSLTQGPGSIVTLEAR